MLNFGALCFRVVQAPEIPQTLNHPKPSNPAPSGFLRAQGRGVCKDSEVAVVSRVEGAT